MATLALVGAPSAALAKSNETAVDWTRQRPPQDPPARAGAVMASDPATAAVVLFGGYVPPSGPANDTWTWDGKAWTQRHPLISPPGRGNAAMASDPATGTVVLFGGFGARAFTDTWTWDGTNWTKQHPAHHPPAADFVAAMAFDPATNTVLLLDASDGSPLADTWTWDGTDWTLQHPIHQPPTHFAPGMASDPATNTVVLFGGGGAHALLDDTWTWDGTDWTKREPTHHPQARYAAVMAYGRAPGTDEDRRQAVVLFGGFKGQDFQDLTQLLGDTWTWNGTDWIKQHPAHQPAKRRYAAMAADPVTHLLVLFGGVGRGGDGSLRVLQSTWIYAPTGERDPETGQGLPGSV